MNSAPAPTSFIPNAHTFISKNIQNYALKKINHWYTMYKNTGYVLKYFTINNV